MEKQTTVPPGYPGSPRLLPVCSSEGGRDPIFGQAGRRRPTTTVYIAETPRVEGLSIRGLAKRYQIGRDIVRQALSDPVSPARKTRVGSSPRLDPFKPAIDAMLTEDTTA